MQNLAFSFEGNWVKQEFDDVTFGRTEATARATTWARTGATRTS